jgi:alkyl sulfatase BDS1-like metallo-beta-lactamase superfamily hydrolase
MIKICCNGFQTRSAVANLIAGAGLALLLWQPLLAQTPLGLNPTQVGLNETAAHRITEQIYQATGFGNTFMVITSEGNVIVDTSLPATAPRHKELLQAVNDGPVKYIVITHAHGDHTGGIALWREQDTDVIAHAEHEEFMHYQRRLAGMFAIRNAAQFPDLPRPAATGAQAAQISPGNYAAEIQPTVLFDREYSFELGGLSFELIHTPGETYDHISVWIPQLKAVFVGDNFYGSFPNIYTLRGTKPRWALDYVNSLNKVLALEPEILIPSHGDALHGNAFINQAVSKYRDAILYVHDETVGGMNQGKDVFTLMQEIVLPDDLNIGEEYGAIAWTVRGIYEGYMGWFDGNPANMYATPVSAVYPDLVALGGGADKVAELSRSYLQDGDGVRAMHMADIALTAEPDNVVALQARLAALEQLLRESANSNEAGWLRFGINETRARLGAPQP